MKNAFMSFLRSYVLKAVAGLAGWRAALANFAIKFGWKYVERFYDKTANWVSYQYGKTKNYFANKKTEKKAEKYEETLKDGVTKDDQRDATTDFLNGL